MSVSRAAADDYERVFAEQLWSLIPAVYRDLDGRQEQRGTLRAFVEAVAAELAQARRSIDRLGEDPFVERADSWALPYLADLVATRLVSARNPRGRRVDVAKTIYYRRRKGTVRVLEELISDITGWDGVVVEEFRRLARTRHGLDPDPDPLRGHVTGTPPGGTADLRSTRGAELAGGPFDEFHHTPDVRRARGVDGRHGVPKLGFHLYRLPAWPLSGVTPGAGPDATSFTTDPSGRDVPLFQRRSRAADWEAWVAAREWDVAAPMRCRVLGDDDYLITDAVVADLVAATALPPTAAGHLRRLVGVRIDGEAGLRTAVRSLPAASATAIQGAAVWSALVERALVADCGKAVLVPGSVAIETTPGTFLPTAQLGAGNLVDWTTPTTGPGVVLDPERGRLRFTGLVPDAALTSTHHIGAAGPVGAGPWIRSAGLAPPGTVLSGGGAIAAGAVAVDGTTEISDNLSYSGLPDSADVVALVFQAADRRRPYVRLGTGWTIDTGAHVESTAVVDGIWLGAGAAAAAVRLRGDFERVHLRYSTLDPGGVSATGATLGAVTLRIEGDVEKLELDRVICGPIEVATGGSIETIVVRDSIIDAGSLGQALLAPLSSLDVARSTIIGRVDVNRVSATEVLAAGVVDVTDTHHGCWRFSAALPGSRLPRPYRSPVLTSVAGVFTSLRFGDPGYTQLSAVAPAAIARGAEDTSELGVWSSLGHPIRLDGLRAKVEEFAPFGLVPFFVFET
jgi:hypothetical protein